MSGRIRTVKPEWLEDEKLMLASTEARLLSIALILLADDYGNGRAHPRYLRSQVFPMLGDDVVERAMTELAAMPYVHLYEIEGQAYYAIVNWKKHQRVDKPGRPRVPPPPKGSGPTPAPTSSVPKVAYFIRGCTTGLIKIGESIDPVQRLAELSRQASERLELLAVGGREADHHALLATDRVHGEWFRASEAVLAKIREHGGEPSRAIASAGYDGEYRAVEVSGIARHPERTGEEVSNGRGVPGNVRGVHATDPDLDLRSPTTSEGAREEPERPEAAHMNGHRSLGALAEELRRGCEEGWVSIGEPAPKKTRELTWPGWGDLARWVRAKADLIGADEIAIAERAVRSFLESPAAKRRGYPVEYLVQNPSEFWSEHA